MGKKHCRGDGRRRGSPTRNCRGQVVPAGLHDACHLSQLSQLIDDLPRGIPFQTAIVAGTVPASQLLSRLLAVSEFVGHAALCAIKVDSSATTVGQRMRPRTSSDTFSHPGIDMTCSERIDNWHQPGIMTANPLPRSFALASACRTLLPHPFTRLCFASAWRPIPARGIRGSTPRPAAPIARACMHRSITCGLLTSFN